jgi:hypothetical protein
MVWEKYASFKLRWKKMDDMKSYMDTITGWLTSSEIINKRIQDELTDLRTHSMKTDLIISFNKKHMSYREQQPDELSSISSTTRPIDAAAYIHTAQYDESC